MKNLHNKIQIASNIAIIIVAMLLAGVLVNRYFFSASAPKPVPIESEIIKAGTKVSLADVDWSKSDKVLLLVLSTTCRYCTESTPFYQKLIERKAGRDDVRLIAVTPQSVEEARRYLSEHGVSVADANFG